MFLSMDVFALTSTKITYEYPITPNDVEWVEFTSLKEKIDACQIPEDILYTIWGEYGLYRHGIDDSPYSHNGANNYYRHNY